nr:antimicrobial peptide lynronne 3-containing protein [uncultured bacterium]
MTAKREEISIGILHVTPQQRRECRGDNRFTARFRRTPWRLCLQFRQR